MSYAVELGSDEDHAQRIARMLWVEVEYAQGDELKALIQNFSDKLIEWAARAEK